MRILFFLAFAWVNFSCNAQVKSLTFYGEIIDIPLEETFWEFKPNGNKKSLVAFKEKLKKYGSDRVISYLLEVKEKLKLNDWLYVSLVNKFCLSNTSTKYVPAYMWFILGESGFRTRIGKQSSSNLRTFIFSKHEVQLPKSGNFYCIDCNSKRLDFEFVDFNPYEKGAEIDFRFFETPNLRKQRISKSITISPISDFNQLTLDINLQSSLIEVLKDYPNIDMMSIVNSSSLKLDSTFLSQIRTKIEPLNDSLKVSYLMHIIASQDYSRDINLFGKTEKWMFPEEYFYYGSGDCEDKSIALSFLIANTTKIPVLIIKYPDHVNVAVSLSSLNGVPDFIFKGLPFYVCEVTTLSKNFIALTKYGGIGFKKYSIVGTGNL